MTIPVLGGQPSTQIIPKLGVSSLTLPLGVSLSLSVPSVGGQPSTQTLPRVPAGGVLDPASVEGMRSVWDAFDSAVYNGSSLLSSITDKGPDANDMVPTTAGMVQTSYNVNAVPTILPGPPTAYQQVLETNLAETINDFTVFLLIPTRTAPATGRVYFAIQKSGGYDLQVAASGTAGHIDIKSATATDAIVDIGLNNGNTGSHAIVGIRKSGSTLIVDVWYDSLGGGGLQSQRTYHTTTIPAIAATGMAFGGRGGLTQFWQGDVLHLASWGDVSVSNYTMEAMAAWAGRRLGFSVPAAVDTADLGFTKAALSDDFVKVLTNFPDITASGTIVLLGTVTAIGTSKGTIARSFNGSGTRGVIFRFASATVLEVIAKDSGGANRTSTYTHGGSMVGSAGRWWCAWGPSGADTQMEVGYGTSSTPTTIVGGIGTGTIAGAGADAAIFDQDATADRAIAGTGLLVVWLSERLTAAQCDALSDADLLDRGFVLMAPQPNVSEGAALTSGSDIDPATGITRTFSTPPGATAGTNNDMVAEEVSS